MKKIVVIGPESTGKSVLVEKLASHYRSPHVLEYAREFLHEHGTDYSFDDLLTIAQGQLKGEDVAVNKALNELSPPPYVFIDTDMHVMHVWTTVVFGQEHPWIEVQRGERQYDFYLLTCPDLPWVADGMREYPDLEMRERLYQQYKGILQNQNTPWIEVRGVGDARTQSAIDALEACFGIEKSDEHHDWK